MREYSDAPDGGKRKEKGPAGARPSLYRSGENTGAANGPYRAIHIAARADIAASVRSGKKFS
ncbi:hypothetical protein RCCGEPOP_30404 [Rhizobium sp. Pop5]|nr:hypothetical protein RCCGEPOP_30404 [Rhizobium sp. Pop5]